MKTLSKTITFFIRLMRKEGPLRRCKTYFHITELLHSQWTAQLIIYIGDFRKINMALPSMGT